MSAPFDLSPDLAQVADGTRPVRLLRRGGPCAAGEVEIPHALARAVAQREAAASDGRYTRSDVAWHLPVAELPDGPHPGDLICEANGRRWTILEVQLVAVRTRWRCIARNLAIAHGLDQSVTVLEAIYQKQPCGTAEPTWRACRTGVPARVQPLRAEVAVAGQTRRTVRRYRVYLGDLLPLDQRHRILAPDGTLYRVLGWSAAERIDQLPVAEVEAC